MTGTRLVLLVVPTNINTQIFNYYAHVAGYNLPTAENPIVEAVVVVLAPARMSI